MSSVGLVDPVVPVDLADWAGLADWAALAGLRDLSSPTGPAGLRDLTDPPRAMPHGAQQAPPMRYGSLPARRSATEGARA
ncbi:hypothetical protein [Streptomyces sp. NPDC059071]|uniref:hypothetical protein n=1 Tax=unclassified Streptomyces TaxID=2593676 RepID=UPI0036663A16